MISGNLAQTISRILSDLLHEISCNRTKHNFCLSEIQLLQLVSIYFVHEITQRHRSVGFLQPHNFKTSRFLKVCPAQVQLLLFVSMYLAKEISESYTVFYTAGSSILRPGMQVDPFSGSSSMFSPVAISKGKSQKKNLVSADMSTNGGRGVTPCPEFIQTVEDSEQIVTNSLSYCKL